MDKILLAMDGTELDRKAFQYAVELCARMKAELKVLLLIKPGNVSAFAHKKASGKMNYAKQVFEGSMMAATFAEAGEFDTADDLMIETLEKSKKLLDEFKKTGVPCKLAVRKGNFEEEVVSYVRKNRNVVATVYGATADQRSTKDEEAERVKLLQYLTKSLPVPVVMVPAEA